jgi:hypothetical protein
MPPHSYTVRRCGTSQGDTSSCPCLRRPGGQASPSGLPPTVRAWPAGEGSDFVTAAGRGSDGRTVIIVNTHGQIRMQDVETGVVRKTVPGPPHLGGRWESCNRTAGPPPWTPPPTW